MAFTIPSCTADPVTAARRQGREPSPADWIQFVRLAARMAWQARTRLDAAEAARIATRAARAVTDPDARLLALAAAADAERAVESFGQGGALDAGYLAAWLKERPMGRRE